MTPEQIELARHALGLGTNRWQSYRNYFVCGPGHSDYNNWQAMVADGNAMKRENAPNTCGQDVFWLTYEGAKAALRQGEKLDQEDFPVSP